MSLTKFIRFSLTNVGRHAKLANTIQSQQITVKRFLFSSDIIGVENFKRQRMTMQEKVGNLKDKFCDRMNEYMETSSTNTIFTDDVKTILYIAETESDLETAVKMIKRFHSQAGELRFSSFVFGPLVYRLLHMLKKPDLAYELFMDEKMDGFFDQMSSFVIVMDLLFESEQYERVLEVYRIIESKLLNGVRKPMDCTTVALATCFKQNTPESFETAAQILHETKNQGTHLSMRSIVYAAMLALKQDKAADALEILSNAEIPANTRTTPLAYYNIRALGYARLGRPEDSVQMLRSVLENDQPDHFQRGNEVFDEVLQEVAKSVETSANKDLQHTFSTISKSLQQGGHVTDAALEEYLMRPVFRRRKPQDGYKQRNRSSINSINMASKRAYSRGIATDTYGAV